MDPTRREGAEVWSGAGASGVQRQDKEVAVWRAAVPGEGIRSCPRSQPPSSQQQGYEPPPRPLPPQLKICLGVKLRHNKTRGALTLSPQQRGRGDRYTPHSSRRVLDKAQSWHHIYILQKHAVLEFVCLFVWGFFLFFVQKLFSKNELHPRWIYYLLFNIQYNIINSC